MEVIIFKQFKKKQGFVKTHSIDSIVIHCIPHKPQNLQTQDNIPISKTLQLSICTVFFIFSQFSVLFHNHP